MYEVMIKIVDNEVDTVVGKLYRIVTLTMLKELRKIYGNSNVAIIKGLL